MTELIGILTSQLNVDEGQAKGGLGLILGLAKDKLEGGDFSKVAELIPGSEGLINEAPSEGGGGLAAGLMGAVGSMLGGSGGALGNLGALAQLTGGFSSLGMKSDMVKQFLPIVTNFLTDKGGDEIQDIIGKFLK